MRGIWAAAFVFILIAGSALAAIPAFLTGQIYLQYSEDVPLEQKNQLNKDLAVLDQIAFQDSDGELQRIFGVPTVSQKEMKKWLAHRARYVVSENHPLDVSSITSLQENVSYPFPGELPKAPAEPLDQASEQATPVAANSSAEEAEQSEVPEDDPSTTMMTNLSGLLYLYGKQSRTLVGFKMAGVGVVEVKTPQVGIFQIGQALFEPLSSEMKPEQTGDLSHTLYRVATLYHEARHCDGHGRTATFPHGICPEGHDYAGEAACDVMANGPYRIDSLFLRSATDGCGNRCTAYEKEVLMALHADSESRILDHTTEWNDEPEALERP